MPPFQQESQPLQSRHHRTVPSRGGTDRHFDFVITQGTSKNASWIVIDGESGNSLACLVRKCQLGLFHGDCLLSQGGFAFAMRGLRCTLPRPLALNWRSARALYLELRLTACCEARFLRPMAAPSPSTSPMLRSQRPAHVVLTADPEDMLYRRTRNRERALVAKC